MPIASGWQPYEAVEVWGRAGKIDTFTVAGETGRNGLREASR